MAILRDLHNTLSYARGLSPVVASDDTAQVSQIIDMKGADALEFVIMAGVLADAAATFTTLVEDGDDSGLSDAAAVADTDLLGTELAATFDQAADNGVFSVGYKGNKRYVRLTITPSGNAASAPLAVLAVKRPHTRGTTS